MKVHLTFKSKRQLEGGKSEVISVDITMGGEAELIQEVVQLLKASGFEII